MFKIIWALASSDTYSALRNKAEKSFKTREKAKKTKPSKDEGLFKQVAKAIDLLESNSRHPSLKTHEYSSLAHPYNPAEKVFEAYAQNNTPSAYRVFWCYGPKKGEITIITISPHP